MHACFNCLDRTTSTSGYVSRLFVSSVSASSFLCARSPFAHLGLYLKYLLMVPKRFISSNTLELDGTMTLSKLERYLSILEVLVSCPLEFENILYQVDERSSVLKNYLDFLISHNLVEKLPLDGKVVVYTITDRGLSLLTTMQGQDYLDKHENLLLVYEE